jgi:hypothetical protein
MDPNETRHMQIQSITASANRAFPNPTNHREQIKFGLSLTAQLHATDDPDISMIVLQAQAEALAAKHQQRLIDDAFDTPMTDLEIKALPTEFFGATVDQGLKVGTCRCCNGNLKPGVVAMYCEQCCISPSIAQEQP